MKCYWLMKSEPSVYSIEDLAAAPGQVTGWDGVRNYQARNFMRDEMAQGDGVLFYHSSATPPGVAGSAEVVREAHPDPTQFDGSDPHYDPKAAPDDPRWFMVDVRLVEIFSRLVPLHELKSTKGLEDLPLLRKGSRLSVMPVTRRQWDIVHRLAKLPPRQGTC